MRETIAKMVGDARRKNLRLGLQTAERAGMHNTIAVALEDVTVRMFGFRIPSATASSKRKTQVGQHPSASRRYFGISLRIRLAVPATSPLSFTRGSKSFFASAGF